MSTQGDKNDQWSDAVVPQIIHIREQELEVARKECATTLEGTLGVFSEVQELAHSMVGIDRAFLQSATTKLGALSKLYELLFTTPEIQTWQRLINQGIEHIVREGRREDTHPETKQALAQLHEKFVGKATKIETIARERETIAKERRSMSGPPPSKAPSKNVPPPPLPMVPPPPTTPASNSMPPPRLDLLKTPSAAEGHVNGTEPPQRQGIGPPKRQVNRITERSGLPSYTNLSDAFPLAMPDGRKVRAFICFDTWRVVERFTGPVQGIPSQGVILGDKTYSIDSDGRVNLTANKKRKLTHSSDADSEARKVAMKSADRTRLKDIEWQIESCHKDNMMLKEWSTWAESLAEPVLQSLKEAGNQITVKDLIAFCKVLNHLLRPQADVGAGEKDKDKAS